MLDRRETVEPARTREHREIRLRLDSKAIYIGIVAIIFASQLQNRVLREDWSDRAGTGEKGR